MWSTNPMDEENLEETPIKNWRDHNPGVSGHINDGHTRDYLYRTNRALPSDIQRRHQISVCVTFL